MELTAEFFSPNFISHGAIFHGKLMLCQNNCTGLVMPLRMHTQQLYTYTMGGVHVSLVSSKTKVASIKPLTIPRLELCGAYLLSNLIHHVRQTLNIPIESYGHGPIALSCLAGLLVIPSLQMVCGQSSLFHNGPYSPQLLEAHP